MKDLKEMDAIAEVIIEHNLPKENILFVKSEQKSETETMFQDLGAWAVEEVEYPNTNLKCNKFIYAGYTFYLIYTN